MWDFVFLSIFGGGCYLIGFFTNLIVERIKNDN